MAARPHPARLFGDEATDGLDALDVLAGRGAVFFPANFGREGLHMWLVAGMFRLLGVTPLALRLPSALAGILTALATYWLGRELVPQPVPDGERHPLARSAPGSPLRLRPPRRRALHRHLLLARPLQPLRHPRRLHAAVRRAGVRGVLARRQPGPAQGRLSRVSVYAVVRTQRRLFLGLSARTFYTASRFFPFFLGGFLIACRRSSPTPARGATKSILARNFGPVVVCFAVAAIVSSLPLGLYFIQHPGSFTQRASAVARIRRRRPVAQMGQAAAGQRAAVLRARPRRPGPVLQSARPGRVRRR